jgi:hypothetical protein
MTDLDLTVRRIDEAVQELAPEVRGLRSDRRDTWSGPFVALLGGVLFVLLMLLVVAAAEAIDVLRELQ